ncbi:transcription factor WhiB [Lentzea atacamensis]|uniref:Transcriptional regulator WhiB n=1 Tax=Lentzea atacamensis TaxID=531938 RepID=A0A316HNT5_9PSEU|nr:WhiB family transcriptional regulator [Lentzea atacamensis]PWK81668.1 transcription factor WhiB [Lentzea atacamensis]
MRHVKRAVYGVATWQEDDDWKRQGLCHDYGWPDLWFSSELKDQEVAVGLCRSCPMLARCREVALANKEIHGVWGAMTERELRGLVRKVAS